MDALDQTAGVADLSAGFGIAADGIDRVAATILVCGHAIGPAEDVAEVVGGVGRAGVGSLDGFPGAFISVLPANLLVGPVDGLLEMPEVGEVETFRTGGGREYERGCESGYEVRQATERHGVIPPGGLESPSKTIYHKQESVSRSAMARDRAIARMAG